MKVTVDGKPVAKQKSRQSKVFTGNKEQPGIFKSVAFKVNFKANPNGKQAELPSKLIELQGMFSAWIKQADRIANDKGFETILSAYEHYDRIGNANENQTGQRFRVSYIAQDCGVSPTLCAAIDTFQDFQNLETQLLEIESEIDDPSTREIVYQAISCAIRAAGSKSTMLLAGHERNIVAGRNKIRPKNLKVTEQQEREAVALFHKLILEKPNELVTAIKERVGRKFGVNRTTVHRWIKKHS